MPRRILAGLLVVLWATAVRADDKQELAKFQGAWKADKAVRDGNDAPPSYLAELRVVISGRKLTILANTQTTAEAEITLDASKSPAFIDLKPSSPKDAPTSKGIYQLDGDRLRLCYARQGGDRPSEFVSKADAKTVLFELKRDKK